jgi:hypothetical protein
MVTRALNFTTFHQVRTMAIQIIEVSFMMVMTIKFCVVIYLPWWWYVSLAQFQLLQIYHALTKILKLIQVHFTGNLIA